MKFTTTAISLLTLAGLLSFSYVRAQEKPTPDTLIVGTIVFEKVKIETGVNEAQWRLLLEKYLVPIIKKAAKKMKAGNYTINVRFLMERDSSIADVRALNDPGYGLAAGAVNVVKGAGPNWSSVEADSNRVRSYHTQPMIFSISGK